MSARPVSVQVAAQEQANYEQDAMRIAHIITRMIVGGAQENLLLRRTTLRNPMEQEQEQERRDSSWRYGLVLWLKRVSSVFRVCKVETAAGVPIGALVAVSWNATCIFDHPSHVQQIPSHEGRVAIGEVILRSTRSFVEVRGSGTGFA
jgi:hypothetical protein